MNKERNNIPMKFSNSRNDGMKESNIFIKKKGHGGILIAILILLFIVWEIWGRSLLFYEEVIVFAEDIPKGEVIEKEMIEVIRVDNAGAGTVTTDQAEGIIGKEAVQFIPKGALAFEEYFAEKRLTPSKNGTIKIVAIPMDWLDSYPETVRRGDTVEFYPVGKKESGGSLVSATVAHVKDGENNEIIGAGGERTVGSPSIETIEVLLNDEQLITLTGTAEYGTKFVLSYQQ